MKSRYLGAVTVFILWTSILVGIRSKGLDIFGTSPLSSLGTDMRSELWFSVGLILAAVTCVLFALSLKQSYTLTRGFWVALLIGQTGQVVAAITPHGGKQPLGTIHTVVAMTLAFSVPIMLFYFARAQTNPKTRMYAYGLFWIQLSCFIIGIGSFIFLFKGAPAAQIITALAFHAWLIFFSFYNEKSDQSKKAV